MGEYPAWYDEDRMKDGIIRVGIYFNDYPTNSYRWLWSGLTKYLRKRCPNVKIEPIEYILTRYGFPVAVKRDRARGAECEYLIENATPKFYEKLFEKLERAKKNGKPKWFGDYYVLIAEVVRK